MKHTLSLILFFGMTLPLLAQTVAHFENLGVQTDQFLNGDDLNGGFESGHIFLPNNFNESYQSWLGWAISATTDTQTPGFNNQYSAITGEGSEGSTAYAVNFSFGPNIIRLTDEARGGQVNGLFITNSTYAYLSMQDGDAFAKKFGGETGDDPDFFKVTLKKYSEGMLGTDSVDFFLADYRFADNAEDYLVDTWAWVDLTTLGDSDSLWLNLSSSDNGQFGMNTPSFFCIDNVTTEDVPTSTSAIGPDLLIDVYPNPVSDLLYVTCAHSSGEIRLIDSRGVVIDHQTLQEDRITVDMRDCPQGVYYLQLVTANGVLTRTIVKR